MKSGSEGKKLEIERASEGETSGESTGILYFIYYYFLSVLLELYGWDCKTDWKGILLRDSSIYEKTIIVLVQWNSRRNYEEAVEMNNAESFNCYLGNDFNSFWNHCLVFDLVKSDSLSNLDQGKKKLAEKWTSRRYPLGVDYWKVIRDGFILFCTLSL